MTTPNEETPKYTDELQVEVPGAPEQVWEAISTGPGIAAWFVPMEVDGREGGTIAMDMGGGMEPAGTVTVWDPPRRFVGEERWQPNETSPAGWLANEYLVEARSGGSCIVRLVTNLFGSGDWDDELESMREGWRVYLHNLQLYLTHFPGQRCSWVMATGRAAGSLDQAWTTYAAALGLGSRKVDEGDRVEVSADGSAPIAGTIDVRVEGNHHRGLLLRVEAPAPGVAMLFNYSWQGQMYATLHLYLFGAEAEAVAARATPVWRDWMEKHFAMADADALTS